MLARDLITALEKLIADSEPHKYRMGEAEITIDTFGMRDGKVQYLGISKDVRITYTADGVYPVLTAWEPEQIIPVARDTHGEG